MLSKEDQALMDDVIYDDLLALIVETKNLLRKVEPTKAP